MTPSSAYTNDGCLVSVEVTPPIVNVGIADSVRVFASPETWPQARPPYTWSVQDSSIATVHARSDTSGIVIGRAPGDVFLHVKSSDLVLGAAAVSIKAL